MRAIALVCVLIMALASSAQAVHMHGKYLPLNKAQASVALDAQQVSGGELNCSLCVVMHSALPVVMAAGPVQALVVEIREATGSGCAATAPWHFAMFSRPPPAAQIL